jgi:hypothetical protein
MTHSQPPAPARVRRRSLLGGVVAAAVALASRKARAGSRSADRPADRRGRRDRDAGAKRPIWIGHI